MAMKMKATRADRAAAIRRNECIVEGCTRPLYGYGFCRECLTSLGDSIKSTLPPPSTLPN
jgi:hypothetical protein